MSREPRMQTAVWITIFLLEAANIEEDDFIEPDGEVHGDLETIGTLPFELKQIFTRIKQLEAEGLLIASQSKSEKNRKRRQLLFCELSKMKRKIDLATDVFFTSVLDEFNLWEANGVGIAENWLVVTGEAEDE